MLRGLTLTVIACVVVVASATPEYFSDKPFAEARAFAAEHDKLFLIKGTAEWCGPCKKMDRTTFRNGRVIKWLTEHAVSASVDVDKQPKIAGELSIRAMPTTILFRGDEELGRVVGYRGPDSLLKWMESASSGKAKEAAPVAQTDIRGRMDHAEDLYLNNEFESATAEYVWLWRHMLEHQPAMTGVRVSFMAGDMADLAEDSGHARAAFGELRNEAEQRLKTGPRTWTDLRDWLVLNERVLQEREPILAWIDRIKDRPTANATLSRVSDVIEGILVEEGRWRLYGSIVENPAGELDMAEYMFNTGVTMTKKEMARELPEMRPLYQQMYRDSVSTLHAGLLAAGRDDEAWMAAERATGFMDDAETRVALIDAAEKAGVLGARHLGLFDPDVPEHRKSIERVRALTSD